MMPAHAHLNLLGWVTMALYGTFYALTQPACRPDWPGPISRWPPPASR